MSKIALAIYLLALSGCGEPFDLWECDGASSGNGQVHALLRVYHTDYDTKWIHLTIDGNTTTWHSLRHQFQTVEEAGRNWFEEYKQVNADGSFLVFRNGYDRKSLSTVGSRHHFVGRCRYLG